MQEDLVRNQLARILASPSFEAAERNRKFLSFVVEQTIEGRAERIKAYTIATEVFGRGKDFDPVILLYGMVFHPNTLVVYQYMAGIQSGLCLLFRDAEFGGNHLEQAHAFLLVFDREVLLAHNDS